MTASRISSHRWQYARDSSVRRGGEGRRNYIAQTDETPLRLGHDLLRDHHDIASAKLFAGPRGAVGDDRGEVGARLDFRKPFETRQLDLHRRCARSHR